MQPMTRVDRDQLYIGGRWVPSAGSGSLEVIDSTTEEVIGTVPEGTAEDIDRAVDAAAGALAQWSAVPPAERTALLAKVGAALDERASSLADLITHEVGIPRTLSQLVQVGLPVATFTSMTGVVEQFPFEQTIGNSVVVREPIGVVGAITPWNYPLHQIAAKVAPALAAGCTVVLKPSEIAPLNAFILAEVVHAAGLPKGVFNLVTGYGPVVGEAIARHPEVDMVSFTGSVRAGKRVAELGAQHVKRVTLELGGKSAAIVLEDADLAQAVKSTVNACFLNTGQTCSAHTRLLVPESRYEEAARLAVEAARSFTVGDPFGDARLGPLTSKAQLERVRGYIAKGVAEGAQLLTGGAERPEGVARGWFVRPTVFGRVDPRSTIAQEEIFGPVLAIIAYRDEDDAVRIANDTIYGLAGGVWSKDEERAKRVARRLRTGQVDINGGAFNMQAPFGGYKQSGRGRELGRPGLEEYLEYKSLQLKAEARPEP